MKRKFLFAFQLYLVFCGIANVSCMNLVLVDHCARVLCDILNS